MGFSWKYKGLSSIGKSALIVRLELLILDRFSCFLLYTFAFEGVGFRFRWQFANTLTCFLTGILDLLRPQEPSPLQDGYVRYIHIVSFVTSFFFLLILEDFVYRYFTWLYAQETCDRRKEESLEEEEKVTITAHIYSSAIFFLCFASICSNVVGNRSLKIFKIFSLPSSLTMPFL